MSSLPHSSVPLFKIKYSEKGTVKDIKKIIARIEGLPSCLNGQIIDFGESVRGIIMGYNESDVLALVMGDENRVRIGQAVTGASEPFTIPVGEGYIGRMIDACGNPCDDGDAIQTSGHAAVFAASPALTERIPVEEPLHTGTKVIDALVPIGKGQRELILGDRMTGKTVLALDAILNQRGKNMVCIYCCIGKSVAALEKVVGVMAEKGALDYSIVMAATDNASVGEQYVAPFSAATIGEFFMRKGRDVLVVFDDITKHAWAYRQLSLLLERPPGREAYPGDIFYIHTQLMERAGRLNREAGGGSMTFLGIADTLQGDMTGYIPSNLISMCDGQVVLSTAMFGEGVRPAVDFSLSMSIVGSKAQHPIYRELCQKLRTEFLEYVEVQRLSKLQSGLSRQAEQVLKKGEAILSVMQQGQYRPVTRAEQVLLLYALREGILTDLDREQKERFKAEIATLAAAHIPGLFSQLESAFALTPELEKGMRDVYQLFFNGMNTK